MILERDASAAPRVAELLKLTSADLLELGIVDGVIVDDPETLAEVVGRAVLSAVGGRGTGRD